MGPGWAFYQGACGHSVGDQGGHCLIGIIVGVGFTAVGLYEAELFPCTAAEVDDGATCGGCDLGDPMGMTAGGPRDDAVTGERVGLTEGLSLGFVACQVLVPIALSALPMLGAQGRRGTRAEGLAAEGTGALLEAGRTAVTDSLKAFGAVLAVWARGSAGALVLEFVSDPVQAVVDVGD